MTLHLTYGADTLVRERLDRWDTVVRRDTEVGPGNWRMLAVWPAARDAAVSGSTGIEGNPLGPAEVEEVLAGAAVDADGAHIREVENYNRALNLARDAAARPDFAWSHEVIHLINATIMEGLPRDTHGDYRRPGEDVFVGIFTGPSPVVVPSLMDELIEWLRRADSTPPLIRSALLHLNVIAIHPFNDGNGRTARILAAMELVRDGIRAPELISIEAYLRRNRDEYVEALRTTLGPSYDPDNHPVTEWLDYYTRISLDRLEARNRILDALPTDLGVLAVGPGRCRRAARVGCDAARCPSGPPSHGSARRPDGPFDAGRARGAGSPCARGLARAAWRHARPLVCALRATGGATAPRPVTDDAACQRRPAQPVRRRVTS